MHALRPGARCARTRPDRRLGGDAGDIKYPYHLVNGRVPADPDVYKAKPGRGVRLRIINAAGDTAYRVALGGHKMTITHTDGFPIQPAWADALLAPILVERVRRVRLDFVNKTTMWHPMHLHGRTYQLGTNGSRKDTTIVLPKKTVSVSFDADNPGQWMLHCHNAYHGEAGMTALVAYQV